MIVIPTCYRMNQPTVSSLLAIDAFRTLPEEPLQWLIDQSTIRILESGDYLFKKDEPIDYLYVILEGKIQLRIPQGNQLREMGFLDKGTVTGILPYSRMKAATGFGVAVEETQILALHRDKFVEMEHVSRDMVQALVGVMTNRARDFTRQQQQNEKMMALGKLSAGLAHELNNPAAAIVRSSSELKKHLHTTPEDFKEVIQMRLTSEQVDQVNNLVFSKINAPAPVNLSMMERNNREDEIMEWMDDHGFADSDEIAENFVTFGMTLEEVEEIDAIIEGTHTLPVFRWLNNMMTTERMVEDIQQASSRIAALIRSVKTYTHMDQTPDKVYADIHEGLDSTLTMLNHQLKKKNIRVVKELDQHLPKIPLYVSELNQVWTNLIDNAVDAMEDQGTLTIRTRAEGDHVRVDVEDNGSGIPPDIQDNIFDPFFTTKTVGQGSGLGLDIVKKIVERHGASINLTSEPGRTVFSLCFPLH